MAVGPMWKTRFVWGGGRIGSGYTSFYTSGLVSAVQAATAAYNFMATVAARSGSGSSLPTGVTVAQDAVVENIDAATGKIQSTTTITPGVTITGVGTAAYAAPAGLAVTWYGSEYLKGRRVRGRTFFVPLDGACLQPDGTLLDTYRSTVNNAANTYILSGANPVIFHRPTSKGGTDGQLFNITAGQAADKVAVLRTRR